MNKIKASDKALESTLRGYIGEDVDTSNLQDLTKTRKPAGYWKNFENVKLELQLLEQKLGHFPSNEEIRNHNSTLPLVIGKYHQGFNEVRKKLGQNPGRKVRGYWQDFDNIKSELEKAKEKIGHYPTGEELRKIGLGVLKDSINRFHGGMSVVSKKLGYNYKRKPQGYWKNVDNFMAEITGLIKDLGYFPSQDELIKLKHQDIANALKYHGGLDTIRQKMGYKLPRKPRNYYSDEKTVINDLNEVTAELGHFPTQPELKKFGYDGLRHAVTKVLGGFESARERLGHSGRRNRNYWSEWENLETELLQVISELGHFPKNRELTSLRKSSIHSAYKYHGGIEEVKRKLNNEPECREQLEGLLEQYAGGTQ